MKIIFPTLLLLTILLLFGQKARSQDAILWKISKDDGSKPSYLLGTYHFLGGSFVDSFSEIKEKLLSADVAIFESKYDQAFVDYYNARQKNEKLQASLSAEDFAYITKVYSGTKIDFNKFMIGELDFYLKATLQTSNLCLDKYNRDTIYMDKYLQAMALGSGKKMIYLEEAAKQFSVINDYANKFNDKFYAKEIHTTLKRLKNKQPNATDCKIVRDYVSFDLDYRFNQECPDAQLSTYRNINWKSDLIKYFNQGNTFVAVGLFHLYYKCGLIKMIQDSGFKVEPVKLIKP